MQSRRSDGPRLGVPFLRWQARLGHELPRDETAPDRTRVEPHSERCPHCAGRHRKLEPTSLVAMPARSSTRVAGNHLESHQPASWTLLVGAKRRVSSSTRWNGLSDLLRPPTVIANVARGEAPVGRRRMAPDAQRQADPAKRDDRPEPRGLVAVPKGRLARVARVDRQPCEGPAADGVPALHYSASVGDEQPRGDAPRHRGRVASDAERQADATGRDPWNAACCLVEVQDRSRSRLAGVGLQSDKGGAGLPILRGRAVGERPCQQNGDDQASVCACSEARALWFQQCLARLWVGLIRAICLRAATPTRHCRPQRRVAAGLSRGRNRPRVDVTGDPLSEWIVRCTRTAHRRAKTARTCSTPNGFRRQASTRCGSLASTSASKPWRPDIKSRAAAGRSTRAAQSTQRPSPRSGISSSERTMSSCVVLSARIAGPGPIATLNWKCLRRPRSMARRSSGRSSTRRRRRLVTIASSTRPSPRLRARGRHVRRTWGRRCGGQAGHAKRPGRSPRGKLSAFWRICEERTTSQCAPSARVRTGS